jgi:hypothetical protein
MVFRLCSGRFNQFGAFYQSSCGLRRDEPMVAHARTVSLEQVAMNGPGVD